MMVLTTVMDSVSAEELLEFCFRYFGVHCERR